MKRHFLGRALVSAICYNTRHHIHPVDVKCSHGSKHAVVQVAVPDEWIDSLLPGVRRVNELVKARNSRLQTGGKRQADDKVSDRAAEGFLQTTLYTGVAFWQNFRFVHRGATFTSLLVMTDNQIRMMSMSHCIQCLQIWDGVCAAQAACSCRHHTYPRI